MRFNALLALFAALVIAGLVEDDTLDKPWDALEVAVEAASEALEAPADAACAACDDAEFCRAADRVRKT